jgi:hypothetical protein
MITKKGHVYGGVEFELMGYKGNIPIKFTFYIYPGVIECGDCPRKCTRNVQIIDIQWYVGGVQVTGTISRKLSGKLSECCEYLKSNIEWPWTDIEFNEYNKGYNIFCKNSKTTTRKERISERHN